MNDQAYHRAMSEAERAIRRGAYAAALRALQDALSEDPNSAEAHAQLSLCLSFLNRRYGASEEADRALALNPELPQAHIAKGFSSLGFVDARSARQSVETVLALDAGSVDALFLNCAIALQEREPKQLRDAASRLLASAPWHHEGKWFMSRAASFEGRGAEAERLAREALSENPEDNHAHEALGWAFLVQGMHAQAVGAALDALRLSPDSQSAFSLLAAARLRQDPLTGWLFWAAVGLLRGSQGAVLTIMMVLSAIYFFTSDVLRFLNLPEAVNALEIVVWTVVIVWVITVQVLGRVLDRELRGVRLSSY